MSKPVGTKGRRRQNRAVAIIGLTRRSRMAAEHLVDEFTTTTMAERLDSPLALELKRLITGAIVRVARDHCRMLNVSRKR